MGGIMFDQGYYQFAKEKHRDMINQAAIARNIRLQNKSRCGLLLRLAAREGAEVFSHLGRMLRLIASALRAILVPEHGSEKAIKRFRIP